MPIIVFAGRKFKKVIHYFKIEFLVNKTIFDNDTENSFDISFKRLKKCIPDSFITNISHQFFLLQNNLFEFTTQEHKFKR